VGAVLYGIGASFFGPASTGLTPKPGAVGYAIDRSLNLSAGGLWLWLVGMG